LDKKVIFHSSSSPPGFISQHENISSNKATPACLHHVQWTAAEHPNIPVCAPSQGSFQSPIPGPDFFPAQPLANLPRQDPPPAGVGIRKEKQKRADDDKKSLTLKGTGQEKVGLGKTEKFPSCVKKEKN